jgi:outer membrane receptor protein involved in Fe transport
MKPLELIFLLACFVLPVSVAAQDPSDPSPTPPSDYEEYNLEALLGVVITATKREQPVDEAPSITTVITHEEIRSRGCRSVAEALQAVPGIALIDDHTYWHIGVRGVFSDFETPSDVVKVMINGQAVAFRPLGANLLGRELIPIEAVKRIEVIRGPGSALYGANAFLGMIHVITFDGSEGHDGAEAPDGSSRHAATAETEYSLNEQRQGLDGGVSILSAGRWRPFQYFVSGAFHGADRSGLAIPGLSDLIDQHLNSQRPEALPSPVGYPSPGWDPATRERLMWRSPSEGDVARTASGYALTSVSLGRAGRLALDANVQYMDRHGEFQQYSYLTHEHRVTYLNGFTRLRYLLDAGEQGFGLAASVAVAGGRPTDDHLVDPLAMGSYKRRLFGYLAVDSALDASYAFDADNVISLGLDLSVDQEDLLTMEVVHPSTGHSYEEQGFGEETFTNVGAYAQATVSPLERLILTVGSRVDYNSQIGCRLDDWACLIERDDGGSDAAGDDATTPLEPAGAGLLHLSNRAAVVYQIPLAGLYLKAMYGSSFRPPSPFQLYHHQGTIVGSTGNPDLRPMTADTVDLLLGSRPLGGLHVNLDLFYTEIDGMVLSYLAGQAVQSRNAGAEVFGLESTATYRPSARFSAFTNASVLFHGVVRPRRLADETDYLWSNSIFNDELPMGMYPWLMVNGGVDLHVPEGHLKVSLLVHASASRRASLVNNLLYNNTSLHKSYEIPGAVHGSLTVSSTGLRWLGMETVVTLSMRGVPGGQIHPGQGGIDIPGRGSSIRVQVEQRL